MSEISIPVELINGLAGTIILFLPGFILAKTLARGLDWSEISTEVFAATTAGGGVVIHALLLWWTVPLVQRLTDAISKEDISALLYVESATWCLTVLIALPFGFGLLLSQLTDLRNPPWLHTLLVRLGLASVVRIPDAWTWKFTQLQRSSQGSWLRVQLKDGGVVVGGFGQGSFASSDVESKDLYLQVTVETNEFGQPKPDGLRTEGMWIAGERIASIEFFGKGTG